MTPATNSPGERSHGRDDVTAELNHHGPATAEQLDPHDAPQGVESFRGDFPGESPIANVGDEHRERRRRQGRA